MYTRYKLIFTILLFASFGEIYAQSVIKGRIQNEANLKLPAANVAITELNMGAVADTNGIYVITGVPVGKYTLKASFLGYTGGSKAIEVKEKDTLEFNFYLKPSINRIDEVVVTATRSERNREEIPDRVEVIDRGEIEIFPATNTDDLLKSIPNIFVNRGWGIFSKGASVNMRGMDATSRVLILLDGVPMNKTAGGSVNWSLVSPDRVERIEVIKGPASALYGNNAMGGVINIITKKGKEDFSVDSRVFAGKFNTFGGKCDVNGKICKENKCLLWGVNGFYRQGDGYITEPMEARDSTDSNVYINEKRFGGSIGYKYAPGKLINVEYNYYDDKRGDGVKIYEPDGSYVEYTTNFLKANAEEKFKKILFHANTFYQREDYFKHTERINETGDAYKLYDANQKSEDAGIWMSLSTKHGKDNTITSGTDVKIGNMDAIDTYRTSTDIIGRKGNVGFFGIFLQDELKFFKKKFLVIAGIRLDYANFYNGSLSVNDPTENTGFVSNSFTKFPKSDWLALSPKISAKYLPVDNFNVFMLCAKGFMPPKIDDLCSSRKISKGFKIANPYLKPEYMSNYELGTEVKSIKHTRLETSVYYSLGKDFQYFVETGNVVDEDRVEYIRENIGIVELIGIEASLAYNPTDKLQVKSSFNYNHSEIKEFDVASFLNPGVYTPEELAEKDLTGKQLIEFPRCQFYLGFSWGNKIITSSWAYNFSGTQWADDMNTEKIQAFSTVDVRFSRNINKHFFVNLDIQNLLDKKYIDKKGVLSPGRFYMLELGYIFF